MQRQPTITLLTGLLLFLAGGCSDSATSGIDGADGGGASGVGEGGGMADSADGSRGSAGNSGGDGRAFCGRDSDCGGGAICVRGRCVGGDSDKTDNPDEEREPLPEVRRQPPATPIPGDRYVFVPLPGAKALARIHLEEFVVDEIDLQAEPLVVTVLPGHDIAVVLTAGDQLIVVDSTSDDGTTQLHHADLRPGMTHLTTSMTTSHVVAWSDHDDLPDSGGNPSEVAVIDLAEVIDGFGGPVIRGLSVGNKPRDVVFDRDGGRLMIVTDDGVSVVPDLAELVADSIAKPSRVHEDDLASSEGRTVLPTPDGRYALVIQPGDPAIRLATLDADRRSEDPAKLVLTGVPSDVKIIRSDDPSRDGRRALVVVRERAEALLLDLPADFLDGGNPEVIPLADQPMGQAVVAPNGEFALLFTTERATSAVVEVDLSDGLVAQERVKARRLTEPVTHIAFAPSSGSAVAFHPAPNDPSRPAFTLMSFERRFFAKPFTTDGAPAWPFVFAPADIGVEQLIVLLNSRSRGIRQALAVPTDSFIAEQLQLREAPVSVGLAPEAGAAFITQDDPEGLITFLDLEGLPNPRHVSRFGRSRRID
jgi:hypothetical protein